MEVITETSRHGGEARVLGGIAVALRCPSARSGGPLTREYADMDLITTRQAAPVLAQTLEQLGYEPAERFNAVHGSRRMTFDQSGGMHVDVFVDHFEMCHRLNLGERIRLHDTTIPLADLLLTKLQIAKLNPKDVTDIAALLLDHDLGLDTEQIQVDFITDLLAHDWGWWRTVTDNLSTLPSHIGRLSVPVRDERRIIERVDLLLDRISAAPKSRRWRVRARAGGRLAWREHPEEVQ